MNGPKRNGTFRSGVLAFVWTMTLFLGHGPARAATGQPGDAQVGGHGQHAHEEPSSEPDHQEQGPEEAAAPQHDHASHAGAQTTGLAGGIAWLGRFHPMIVHFPIALLLAAALAELLAMGTQELPFAFVARFCLWGGTLGAAPLGWANAVGAQTGYSGFLAGLLEYHRWIGTSTAVVATIALFLCERQRRSADNSGRSAYRTALLLSASLVIVTGHLGAALVFGWTSLTG